MFCSELVAGSKTQDPGVKNAMLKALHEVVSKAGANTSEASRQSILGIIDLDSDDLNGEMRHRNPFRNSGLISTDAMSITSARLLGGLIKTLPSSSASTLIKYDLLCLSQELLTA